MNDAVVAPAVGSRWVRKLDTIFSRPREEARVMGVIEGYVVARYKGCIPFMRLIKEFKTEFEALQGRRGRKGVWGIMSEKLAILTREQVMKCILKMRGYIVTLQPAFVEQFPVGYVLSDLGGEGLNIGNFIVTAKTSERDFFEQCRLSKRLEPRLWAHGSPTSHLKMCKKRSRGEITYWRLTPTRKKKLEATND